MAITFSNLGASANPDINDSTDATSYANSSWTPPTSGLIFVFVAARRAATGDYDAPTISGNGLTWVTVASVSNSVEAHLTLLAADASGSSTGITTISFPNTQFFCTAVFGAATGVELAGGAAAAFAQTVTGSGTGTSLSLALAAASNTDNRPIAGFNHAASEGTTPRTNWTELDDLNGSLADRGVASQYRDDAFETTASASWATSRPAVGITAELRIPSVRTHQMLI